MAPPRPPAVTTASTVVTQSSNACVSRSDSMVPNNYVSKKDPPDTPMVPRQACLQYSGCCCNCGSILHSLRCCRAPFENVFSLFSTQSLPRTTDRSMLETCKLKMHDAAAAAPRADIKVIADAIRPGVGPTALPPYFGSTMYNADFMHSINAIAPPPQPSAPPSAPDPAPAATRAMRYGPTYKGNSNPNTRHGTF